MREDKKILNLIGLATKAGKAPSGEFSTEKAVKEGKEASENTKKMFRNMCTYYEVPLYYFGKKEELGRAMGKEMRASLAIVDGGFAGALEKLMNDNGGSEYERERFGERTWKTEQGDHRDIAEKSD